MTLDERIRINLDSAASSVPGAEPSPVDRIKHRSRARRLRRQAGFGLVIAAIVVGTVLLNSTGADQMYVADGERIIATSPPIIAGAESPPVEFDTSELGEEAFLTPVINTERILERAKVYEGEIIRVTVLGETPEGRLALVVHSELDNPDLGRIQEICLTSGSCSGQKVEDTVDLPGGLLPLETGVGPTYASGESAPAPSELTWVVPAETAAVTLNVIEDMRWQLLVGDVAVFDTSLQDGDSFQLTAYDSAGNIVDQWLHGEIDQLEAHQRLDAEQRAARERARQQALEQDLEPIAGYGDFSDVEYFYVDWYEVTRLEIQCLRDQGFAVEAIPPGDGIDFSNVPEQENAAAERTLRACQAGLNLPDHVEPTHQQLAEHYSYLLEVKQCIEAEGYETSEPPSDETYINTGGLWSPYDLVVHDDTIGEQEWNALNKTCPQHPKSR